MRVTVHADALRRALMKLQPVIGTSRSRSECRRTCRLVAHEEGGLDVVAFDTSAWVWGVVRLDSDDVHCAAPGTVVTSTPELLHAARRSGGAPLTLEHTDTTGMCDHVMITWDRFELTVWCDHQDQFVSPPEVDALSGVSVQVRGEALVAAVDLTAAAMDARESYRGLDGIDITIGDTLDARMRATDGHRYSVVDVPVERLSDGHGQLWLPAPAASVLRRACGRAMNVTLTADESYACCVWGDCSLVFGARATVFPDANKVIDGFAQKTRIAFPKTAMLEALRAIEIGLGRLKAIDLVLPDASRADVTLESVDHEGATSARVSVPVMRLQECPEARRLRVNAFYLRDAIATIPGKFVNWAWGGETDATMLTPYGSALPLTSVANYVMPIRWS